MLESSYNLSRSFLLLFAFRSIFDNSFSSPLVSSLREQRNRERSGRPRRIKDTDRLIRANEIFPELHKGVNERVRCLEITAPIYSTIQEGISSTKRRVGNNEQKNSGYLFSFFHLIASGLYLVHVLYIHAIKLVCEEKRRYIYTEVNNNRRL